MYPAIDLGGATSSTTMAASPGGDGPPPGGNGNTTNTNDKPHGTQIVEVPQEIVHAHVAVEGPDQILEDPDVIPNPGALVVVTSPAITVLPVGDLQGGILKEVEQAVVMTNEAGLDPDHRPWHPVIVHDHLQLVEVRTEVGVAARERLSSQIRPCNWITFEY